LTNIKVINKVHPKNQVTQL